MYCINNKLIRISFLLITIHGYFTNTSSLNTVFMQQNDLDFETFLTMNHEACNADGCFIPKKFYFVQDPLIVCPAGYTKLAYMDQKGRFRVGSLKESSRRAIELNPKIIENCFNHAKKLIKKLPNYMSPTLASEAKMVKQPVQRKNPHTHTNELQQAQPLTQIEDNFQTPQRQAPNSQNQYDSFLRDDESEIDSFTTVKQYPLEDSQCLNNSFPQNMFDDKGDVIYGTGLIVTLLSFIGTLIKLILNKNETKKQLDQYANINLQPQQKSSTLNFPAASNANNYYTPCLHVPQKPTQIITQLATSVPNVINFQPRHYPETYLPPPPIPQSPVLNSVIQIETFKDHCGCKAGNCIKDKRCKCFNAKRACGPACHGENGININCKATTQYAIQNYPASSIV